MKQFNVTLGLGRLANNHPKTYNVTAQDEKSAISAAKSLYYDLVQVEIGSFRENPIWSKFLCVSKVEETKGVAS